MHVVPINTLRPRQNGRHFPDDISNRFFWMKIYEFWLNISLEFVPRGPTSNIPALVQIMAWRRPGDKPLFEPMTVSVLTHICVTRPQWVLIYAMDIEKYVIIAYLLGSKSPVVKPWGTGCMRGNIKYAYGVHHYLSWDDIGGWSPHPRGARVLLFWMGSTIVADGLPTQGARE